MPTEYIILVINPDDGLLQDLGEGPFDTVEDATEYAECEVGVAYRIAAIGPLCNP